MAEPTFNPTGTTELNTQLTFAGAEPRPIQGKAMSAAAVAPQGGQQGKAGGGQVLAQNLSAGPTSIPTMLGGFLDLASKVIEPKLKEARQRAAYEGMQAYVAGAKIEDMRREQNPILKMFGEDGAFVKGAVLHQSASTVSSLGKYFNDNMAALVELDPQAFGEHVQQVTGQAYASLDPAAQAAASPQMIELQTQVMASYTAGHELFRKDKALKTTVESVVAAGGLRQSMASGIADGTLNSQDVAAADSRVLELLDSKPASVSTKEWQQVTLRSMQSMLENGHFKGYEVAKRSASWQSLEPEQRDRLDNLAEAAWQSEETKNPAYLDGVLTRQGMFARLQQGTTDFSSPEELLSWMEDQDAESDRVTGQPAFNNRQKAQYIDAYYAGLNRAAKSNVAAADDQLADSLFTRYVNTGGDADISMLTTEQMAIRGQRAYEEIATTEDPVERGVKLDKFVAALAADGRAAPPQLKQQLDRDLSALRNGDPVTERTLQSLAVAQEVMSRPNGVKAMTEIVGGENALAYKALLDLGINFNDPNAVEKHTRSMRAAASVSPSPTEVEAMQASIKSGRSWLPWKSGQLRTDSLSDPGAATLASVAAPLAARYRKQFPGLSEDEVINAALADARRGGDVVAGMFVRPNPTSAGLTNPRTVVAERLGRQLQPKIYAEATMKAAQNAALGQAKARGWEDFDPTGYRAVDSFNLGGGAVQLTFRTYDRWGIDAPDVGDIKITLTADQIAAQYLEQELLQAKANAGTTLMMPVPIVSDILEAFPIPGLSNILP